MKKKIKYQEHPWGKDEPQLGDVIEDFLPSPAEMRKARVRILNAKDVSVRLTTNEAKALDKKAKKVGLSSEGLLAGIVRDYVEGKLVLRD